MKNRFGRCGTAWFGQDASVTSYSETHRQFKVQCSGMFSRALLALALGIASFGAASCSSNSAKTLNSSTPIISVAIVQAPPSSLVVGTSAPVSASVSNDSANAGVDWVAICGSTPNCGTFSPAHTASGGATMFTAPIGVPSGNTVQVTALSTTNRSKTAAASVTIDTTVTGITITQGPPATAAQLSTITLAATVANDPANLGVDWTFNCAGVSCTPPGGVHSASGAVAQFQVPGPALFPTLAGSNIIITAYPTADHSFSATASFLVTAGLSISLTQPPPSTMPINGTTSVIATVANDATNAGVDWSVSCSSPPCGTFGSAQLTAHTASGQPVTFTAPPTPPVYLQGPPVVTITATATAGGVGKVTATASVTIFAPIAVQITKGVQNNLLAVNGSALLTATVANDSANAGVDWSVTCQGPGGCGSFSPAHTASGATTTYTAPSAVPTGGSVTITAASTSSPTTTATDTVSITATLSGNSLLQGQFVILVHGQNSKNGPYTFGGVISGDGNGNITSGSLDWVDGSGNAAGSNGVVAPSTYSISPDGQGQIQLSINTAALSSGSFGGTVALSIAFATPQHALVSELDTFGSGTGTLDLQNVNDLNGFVNGTSGFNGNYSLQLSGVEAANPDAGYFVAGALALQGFEETGYIVDQSDNGAISSVPFAATSYYPQSTVSPNGEATMSSVNFGLPTKFNLDLWLIDINHFVVTDWMDAFRGTPSVLVGGYLTAQPSSPSVSGTYAFTEAGATTAAQPQVAGGILTCGSTGTLDVTPLGGTALSNQAVNVTCTAPANGRGLIAISNGTTAGINQFAAYPTLDQGLYLIELDGGSAGTSGPSGAGLALQQTLTAPISATSFSGNYASNFISSTATGTENFTGLLTADGISTLSGSIDVNSFDATAAPQVGTPSPGASLAGSFTTNSNGRFPLALTITPATGQPTPPVTSINPACYIIDANTCLLLGLDVTAPGTGIMLQQSGL